MFILKTSCHLVKPKYLVQPPSISSQSRFLSREGWILVKFHSGWFHPLRSCKTANPLSTRSETEGPRRTLLMTEVSSVVLPTLKPGVALHLWDNKLYLHLDLMPSGLSSMLLMAEWSDSITILLFLLLLLQKEKGHSCSGLQFWAVITWLQKMVPGLSKIKNSNTQAGCSWLWEWKGEDRVFLLLLLFHLKIWLAALQSATRRLCLGQDEICK